MRAPNRQRLRLSSGPELSFITAGESPKPAVNVPVVTPDEAFNLYEGLKVVW